MTKQVKDIQTERGWGIGGNKLQFHLGGRVVSSKTVILIADPEGNQIYFWKAIITPDKGLQNDGGLMQKIKNPQTIQILLNKVQKKPPPKFQSVKKLKEKYQPFMFLNFIPLIFPGEIPLTVIHGELIHNYLVIIDAQEGITSCRAI